MLQCRTRINPGGVDKTKQTSNAGMTLNLSTSKFALHNFSQHPTNMSRPEDQLYAMSAALLRAARCEVSTNMLSIAHRTSTTMTQPPAHTPLPLEYNIFSHR